MTDQEWMQQFADALCTEKDDGYDRGCVVKTADGKVLIGLGKHRGYFYNPTAAKNSLRYSLIATLTVAYVQKRGVFPPSDHDVEAAINVLAGKVLKQILQQGIIKIEKIESE